MPSASHGHSTLTARQHQMLSGKATRWTCNSCRQRFLHQSRLKIQLRSQRFESTYSSSREDFKKSFRKGKGALRELPNTPARTRFAPSPTGHLHLGSLRTALFNYLLARKTKGQFLLRIEDTDTKRTVPGAVERICEDLAWAGLQWDEGPEVGGPYGPYRQSERLALYQEHAHKLVESGHAYRCFCTSERLLELAKARHESGLSPGYDRVCSLISKAESDERAHKGEKHTVRFKSGKAVPEFVDLVYGSVRVPRPKMAVGYEDSIVLKSDGFPTYHLANVIDDHYMKITHVVRATEWMNSTPKHLAMYEAFGWQPPLFAHVGLLTSGAGAKLSKRQGDTDVAHYRRQGYFSEALTNFCALLGWSHQEKSDVFTMSELIDKFTLKFTKGNQNVGFKKLDFLQKEHARRKVEEQGPGLDKLMDEIVGELQQRKQVDPIWGIPNRRDEREYIKALLNLRLSSANGSYMSPGQFLNDHQALFQMSITPSETVPELTIPAQKHLRLALTELANEKWTLEGLRDAKCDAMVALAKTREKQTSDEELGSPEWRKAHKEEADLINKYLRWALMSSSGPDTTAVMVLLGRDTTLKRLEDAEKR